MNKTEYRRVWERGLQDFENICKRCGECCGSKDGDPCTELCQDESGKYYCRSYQNRLGPRYTVSGQSFTCVTIKHVITYKGLKKNCAYRFLQDDD